MKLNRYVRTGLYPSPKPEILGKEASGRIVSLGPTSPSSPKFSPGDRVVWMGTSSYAEYSVVPAHRAFKVPDSIGLDSASAALLQGLTALTLVEEAHKVLAGDWILVLAASGGVGGWLCQILRAKGAKTIAVVGSKAKVEVAKEAGADIVVVEREGDVLATVREKTGGEGVRAVFDGVGKVTFERSLECVARKGSLVSFGNASGAVPPFSILWVPHSPLCFCPYYMHFAIYLVLQSLADPHDPEGNSGPKISKYLVPRSSITYLLAPNRITTSPSSFASCKRRNSPCACTRFIP